MNCFVIMPFATDFDDVYATIKQSVDQSLTSFGGRCFRLDEMRPAGRITERLLSELRAATFCVADVTGNSANVMWELGFAMALGKPVILVTQCIDELPFDIRDLQTIEYQRSHLTSSLAQPLARTVLDTVASLQQKRPSIVEGPDLVSNLLEEVNGLKKMVSEVVRDWKPIDHQPVSSLSLASLVGAWVNEEGKAHAYARLVKGELIAPYCFSGNHRLTGVYYGWRRTGDYWFARYKWLTNALSGFTFLKQESLGLLRGAWWSAEQQAAAPESPPVYQGIQATWRRHDGAVPAWAEEFFAEAEQHGIQRCISERSSKSPSTALGRT